MSLDQIIDMMMMMVIIIKIIMHWGEDVCGYGAYMQ